MATTSQAHSSTGRARRRPAPPRHAADAVRQDHLQLIERSPDGILLTLQNRITYVNRAALDLFGARAREQLDGRSLFDFFDSATPLPPLRIQEVIAGDQGGPVAAIGKLYRLDGDVADIELLAAPYRRGDQAGSLLILHPLCVGDPAFAALCAPAAA
ncbi:MAG: PAS domain-containing protein, partial [Burkholderiaceae bacterium]